jgi:hypothetical protein
VTRSSDTFGAPIRPIQADLYASATLNRQFSGTSSVVTSGLQVQPGRCVQQGAISEAQGDHSTPNPF